MTLERDNPISAAGRGPWHNTSRGHDGAVRNLLVIALDVLVVTALIVLTVMVHW
jgi:hypothetical protein